MSERKRERTDADPATEEPPAKQAAGPKIQDHIASLVGTFKSDVWMKMGDEEVKDIGGITTAAWQFDRVVKYTYVSAAPMMGPDLYQGEGINAIHKADDGSLRVQSIWWGSADTKVSVSSGVLDTATRSFTLYPEGTTAETANRRTVHTFVTDDHHVHESAARNPDNRDEWTVDFRIVYTRVPAADK